MLLSALSTSQKAKLCSRTLLTASESLSALLLAAPTTCITVLICECCALKQSKHTQKSKIVWNFGKIEILVIDVNIGKCLLSIYNISATLLCLGHKHKPLEHMIQRLTRQIETMPSGLLQRHFSMPSDTVGILPSNDNA